MYFDTHAHLTLCTHVAVADHVQLGKQKNVVGALDAGLQPCDFLERKKILTPYDNIFLGVAYAPSDATTFPQTEIDALEKILQTKDKKVCAISEIGLEYFHHHHNHDMQKKIFSAQLQLSKSYDLPVFLHIRDAYQDAYQLVKASGVTKGCVHCFSSNIEDAKKFLELNFMLSFSGIVTYKNATEVQEAARYVPMEKIVTETDSPYLSPTPKRGEKNGIYHLPYIHEHLANLKKINLADFNKQVYHNVNTLLFNGVDNATAINNQDRNNNS